MAAGVKALGSSPVWRRLPVLAVLGLGLLLWKSPWLTQERELVWEPPPRTYLNTAEIQLWQGTTLLKRELRDFKQGGTGEWVQRIHLKRGDYRAEIFISQIAVDGFLHETRNIHLEDEASVRLPLFKPTVRR